VGQASLAGYVQEQSGEFSVIPTGVKRLRPSVINVPSLPSRTRVPTLLARRQVRAALGVVTALGLVGGGFAAWKLWLSPRPPPKEAVAISPPLAVATPLKAQEPAGVAATEAPPPAESEPAVAAEELPETGSTPRLGEAVVVPKPGRERPRRERRSAKPVVGSSSPVAQKSAEPEPEEVLTGEGTLRIRATAEGRVEVKLPGLGRVGLPVLNQRIAAGKHTAEFFMEGGSTARCTLIVRPDRRTIATFNGKTCSTE
jgi:hypothetical protein